MTISKKSALGLCAESASVFLKTLNNKKSLVITLSKCGFDAAQIQYIAVFVEQKIRRKIF